MSANDTSGVANTRRADAPRNKSLPKRARVAKARAGNLAAKRSNVVKEAATPGLFPVVRSISEIRREMGLTQAEFARLVGYSVRSVAEWERGGELAQPVLRAVTQIERLFRQLRRVMAPGAIRRWGVAPNEAFGGRSPFQLIETGHIDELWQMLFEIESGQLA
jgi:DNA-binding transcriptional regulator YiaG